MELNTLEILRKELIGRKLIMYDNNIVRKPDGAVVTLCRTFQPSKRKEIENLKVALIITNVAEAPPKKLLTAGGDFQFETGIEVHPFSYYSNFEIED